MRVPPWLVFFLSLAGSLLLWQTTRQSHQEIGRVRFHNRATHLAHVIQKELTELEKTLLGCTGLFSAPTQVTRKRWHDYVTELDMARTHPGIQGIGFAQRVVSAELTTHVQGIQAEGFASYTVQPAGDRTEYFPIIYLEPFRDRNLRAFGYDMFSEPVRKTAMERARDEGKTTLSGMVTLLQETPNTSVQKGVLLYHPVYTTNDALEIINERRQKLLGFAYLPIRLGDFLGHIVTENDFGLGVSVFVGEETSFAHLAYVSTDNATSEKPPDSYLPKFEETIRIHLFGQAWTVQFVSQPSFDATTDSAKPWLILFIGFFASVLIGATMYFLEHRQALQAVHNMNFVLQQAHAECEVRVLEQTAELKKMVGDLRKHEGQYKLLVDHLQAGVVVYSADSRVLFCNTHAAGFLNLTPEQLLGRSVKENAMDFLRENRTPMLASEHPAALVLASGQPLQDLVLGIPQSTDGKVLWVQVNAFPEFDDQGRLERIVVMTMDISTLKLAEEGLRDSEARYRMLFENTTDGILVADLETKGFVFANPAMCLMLGYSEEELQAMDVAGIHPKNDLPHLLGEFVATAVGGRKVFTDVPCLRKDGIKFFADIHAAPIIFDRKPCLVGFFRDITEKKLAKEHLEEAYQNLEQKVTERTAQLRAVIDTANDGIITIFSDGTISTFNSAAEKIFGYQAAEIIGQNVRILAVEPCRSEHDGYLKRYLDPSVPHVFHSGREIIGARKDGTTFPMELSVAEFSAAGKRMFSSITRDISARKSAEDLMKTAKEEALQANRAKSDFVSNVSHEIRTPLNAIIGFADLALKTGLNKKQADYLAKIQLSGLHLLRIVNDILDFSKIEAGKFTIENTEFCFDDVVNTVVAMVGPPAAAKDLNIIINVPFDVPRPLIGDPLRLGQILTNLMSNAVKFTEQGEIELSVSQKNLGEDRLELYITVRDTGIGLTPDQLTRLFRPFTQADASTTRKFGGTGLGLNISKRLVEMMGGKVSIESTAGKGTVISFSIFLQGGSKTPVEEVIPANLRDLRILVLETYPTMLKWFRTFFTQFPFFVNVVASTGETLAAVDAKEDTKRYDLLLIDTQGIGNNIKLFLKQLQEIADPRNHPKVILLLTSPMEDTIREQALSFDVKEFLLRPITPSSLVNAIINIFTPLNRKRVATSAKLAENRDLDGLTIFLVEDNAMNQQIAQELLESAGITVKIANNGLEVVEALMAEPEIVSCDAILMDIQMPEMDGYEAARRIRKMPRHAVTPIIAMTAHAMAEDRNEAAAAGMNDHIAKPITPKDLFQTIRRWTKSVSPEKIGLPGLGKDLPAGFPAIPGVDVQEGLGRLVGNAQTYLGLLKKFPMTQEGELRKIGQAIADKDLEQTQALIHRLKGLAGNLSLTDLFQAAAALEKALHVPDWAESTRRFEILETEFHQFSQAIEAFSPAELCGESLEKLASGPSLKMMTLPLAEVLIEELKTLLLANNSQATQSLKSMVAGFECPAACATDFVALESAIDRFDFDQALRILAAIEIKLDNTRKKTDET